MSHQDANLSALGQRPLGASEPPDHQPLPTVSAIAIPQDIDLGQPPPAPSAHEPDPTADPDPDPDPSIDEEAMVQADHALALQLAQEDQVEVDENDAVSFFSIAGPHTALRYKASKWSVSDDLWANKLIVPCNLLIFVVSIASVVVTASLPGPSPASTTETSAHECRWIPLVNCLMLALECVYFSLLALQTWMSLERAHIVRHPLYLPKRADRIRRGVDLLYYSTFGIQLALFCAAIVLTTPVTWSFSTACPNLPPATLPLTLTWVALVGALMLPVAAFIVFCVGYLVWVLCDDLCGRCAKLVRGLWRGMLTVFRR